MSNTSFLGQHLSIMGIWKSTGLGSVASSLCGDAVSVKTSVVVSMVSVVVASSAHSGKSQSTCSDSLSPKHFPSVWSTCLLLNFCPLPQEVEHADQSLQSLHLHFELVGSIEST